MIPWLVRWNTATPCVKVFWLVIAKACPQSFTQTVAKETEGCRPEVLFLAQAVDTQAGLSALEDTATADRSCAKSFSNYAALHANKTNGLMLQRRALKCIPNCQTRFENPHCCYAAYEGEDTLGCRSSEAILVPEFPFAIIANFRLLPVHLHIICGNIFHLTTFTNSAAISCEFKDVLQCSLFYKSWYWEQSIFLLKDLFKKSLNVNVIYRMFQRIVPEQDHK